MASSLTTANSSSNSILSSPFFRTDIVLGLAQDSLTSTSFPREELAEIFNEPSTSTSINIIPTSTSGPRSEVFMARLSESQRQALEQAIKALSSQLALPENQLKLSDSSPRTEDEKNGDTESIASSNKLIINHVRLQLGGCLLLAGELARSAAQLELVSNDLRPTRSRKKVHDTVFSDLQRPGEVGSPANWNKVEEKTNEDGLKSQVPNTSSRAESNLRIKALVALSKVSRLQGREKEALNYQKWAGDAGKVLLRGEGSR